MNMIGTENFIIKRAGEIANDLRIINQYRITTTDDFSSQLLYITEEQVDELIGLLQKVKEIL